MSVGVDEDVVRLEIAVQNGEGVQSREDVYLNVHIVRSLSHLWTRKRTISAAYPRTILSGIPVALYRSISVQRSPRVAYPCEVRTVT